MKLFDTLSDSLKELKKDSIKVYCCGPTVYNKIHIGNARPIIIVDVLVRFLESQNIKVNYLMNITDIDDKIINKAIEENTNEVELAARYAENFKYLLDKINIRKPDALIPVSDKMDKVVSFLEYLENNNFAYEKSGDLYFDIEKLKNSYLKISKQKDYELLDNVRIDNSLLKKNSSDFTLWKKTNYGLQFETKWSNGRPGWHTECVALIDDYFNSSIDLHAGGMDLKFPHHENERIQYLAKTGNELSNLWFHIGHILLENQKMSKSVGNIILLEDFLLKNTSNILRYLFLTSKFSQPINVTENLISQANKWEQKVLNLLKKMNIEMALKNINNIPSNSNEWDLFVEEMNNNLNTSGVVTLLDNMIKKINKELKVNMVSDTYNIFLKILRTLGFDFEVNSITKDNINLILKWKKLLNEKQFLEADEIRRELELKNIL